MFTGAGWIATKSRGHANGARPNRPVCFYRPPSRQTHVGRTVNGAVQRSGRRLAQQFEQHHIRKRYHAIVRGWLMDDAVLDYPLVEERDKIADKFAREDKAPQPAVTQYRGLATVEMAVPTGRYPTTRYGLVELEPKTGRKHQLRRHLAHLRHPIIGDSKHGDLRQNRSAAEHFACRRLMLHASRLELTHPFTGQPLIIQAGLDETRMQALTQFGWRGLLLTMKGLSLRRRPGRMRLIRHNSGRYA